MKTNSNNQIIMYKTADGKTKVRVEFSPKENTARLTLDQIAELFDRDKSTISRHIKNIFDEGELDRVAVVVKNATTASDGKTYNVDYYNLDMIISVGYRVNSLRGTQFRIWATQILHEYIKKGFAMNDELLKEAGGGSYFKELLERIRDIRSSEKVLYRQVLDLFATSVDYDGKSESARLFFKKMQNKLHYASHGHTAAEIVSARANADLPFMGLTVFKGSRPNKDEVTVAKNYLTEKELAILNRVVSAYFDMAEVQAIREIPMHMKDWLARLDKYITANDYDLLSDAGTISASEAETKALSEYEQYKKKPFDDLTQVEKDFLLSLKEAQAQIEKNSKKGKV